MSHSNKTGSGTASISTDGPSGFTVSKVFDGNDSTFLEVNDSGQFPNTLKYDFGSGNAYKITAISITIKGHSDYINRSPKDFWVEGSNDDSTYVHLGTFSNVSIENLDSMVNQTYVFSLVNSTAYRYIQIVVNNVQNGGNLLRVQEIGLYEGSSVGSTGPTGPTGADGGGVTINNPTENELVTVSNNTNQLDAEAGLTFAGGVLNVTGNIHTTVHDYGTTSDVDVYFDEDALQKVTLNGNVDFSTAAANKDAGKSIVVKILCDSTDRTFTWNSSWVFIGEKPTSIAANKTALLSMTCFGTNESDIICSYAVQD